jgi:hypothetical protein
VVLDCITGSVHHLDRLGTLIWACFDGSASIDELVARLSDAFAMPSDSIQRDLSEFVHTLGERDLLASPPPRAVGD